MLIRRAEPRDLPALNRLLFQVLEVHHKGRPDIFMGGTKKYTDEEILAILKDESTPVFVAEGDAGVVGYAFCVFMEPKSHVLTPVKSLYIDDLCVDESARGHGIGKALYAAVLDLARETACYNVTLNVWSCNESAMRFYESCGLLPQKVGMEIIL